MPVFQHQDAQLFYSVLGLPDAAHPPLVLLHGGFGSSDMFQPLLPSLMHRRQIITLDFRGHGRTADTSQPFSPELFAGDVLALLDQLHCPQADVLGYSMGAGVAVQLAFHHPEWIRRLVVVSFPYARRGWFADPQLQLIQLPADEAVSVMSDTPLAAAYRRIAPDPDGWPQLVVKSRAQLAVDYDWSAEVRRLAPSTLLVCGDADGLPVRHMSDFFGLLGGGVRDGQPDRSGMTKHALAVLPQTTHYEMLSAPLLGAAVQQFLDAGEEHHGQPE